MGEEEKNANAASGKKNQPISLSPSADSVYSQTKTQVIHSVS